MEIAQRMKKIYPSPTLAASDLAKKLKAKGKDVISLTLGQPDFRTSENIETAAKIAIEQGKVGFYTATRGLDELISAIKVYFAKFYGVHYEKNQLIVTTGAKFALYALFQAILNINDEVLIPAPFWVSYVDQVKLAEGKPIIVPTQYENNYKVKVADLKQYLTSRTKAIVINSPSNPSGAVYSKAELAEIGAWAVKNDLLIIADDIYGRLVYNGTTFTSIAAISPEITKQTVVINGLSKAYAMPGWRVGFTAGPKEIIAQMLKIATHATSNITAVSQYAAIAALTGSQDSVTKMIQSFEERLNLLYPLINDIPGFKLEKPQGAFYFFPNVQDTLVKCKYDTVNDFTNDLLAKVGVATVSGTAFGNPENLRISYAQDISLVTKALERIKDFVITRAGVQDGKFS